MLTISGFSGIIQFRKLKMTVHLYLPVTKQNQDYLLFLNMWWFCLCFH